MKTANVVDGEKIFNEMPEKNVVSWTSLLSGYSRNGLVDQAIETFFRMQAEGIKPSPLTFATVLGALADDGAVKKEIQVYCMVIKNGFEATMFMSNSLINMYSKSGMVRDARAVFDSTENRDAVSWNGMIAELGFARQLHSRVAKDGFESDLTTRTALMVVYSKSSEMDDALRLFYTMRGVWNVVSWTAMISGYLQNSGVEQAIHAQVIKTNYEKSPSVGTALLDAYIKIGHTSEAAKVFVLIEEKDIVAWSAMLGGYAQLGDTKGAVKVFLQLAKDGVRPNEFTFCSVMNACASPIAAVEQGKPFHASSIKSGYNNALCRFMRYAQKGYGKKALKVFEEMRFRKMEMDVVTFIGVISACTHAGLVVEGERYFNMMVKDHFINPTMEHYSSAENWKERAKVRKLMDERKVKKEAGYSWIEVKNKTYSFLAGDHSHPLSDQIYLKLEELGILLKDAGYLPDTNYVLHDVEEEHNVAILSPTQ
ncbi:hypothetical protein RHMOL_Rhmol02G0267700 [Rhododendron molle]|uniref:Uncharacterized protein n=1 Tax=Rhododendron molle TaxID=49168 RepID=A0ACC0PX93_RHOML|nr:hypothetical protein RHMOL_Rhmol02G0267700 [Rhododendron molle]